jgi:hypothetical protein
MKTLKENSTDIKIMINSIYGTIPSGDYHNLYKDLFSERERIKITIKRNSKLEELGI